MSYSPQAPGAMPPQWTPSHVPTSDANRPLIIALIVVGCLLLLAIGGCMVLGFHLARQAQRATESITQTMVPLMETQTEQEIQRLERRLDATSAGSPERADLERQLRAMRELRDSLKERPTR
ncbi:MAG TPA: hypothetical protein PLQ54_07795 [Armatimonadota bacterium]|nr:hypothetical protein [Armatimonadota bacterium]